MAKKKFNGGGVNGGSHTIRKGPMRNLAKERRWRERVARWQRSGLGIRTFCQREKLKEPAFYAWRRELARRSAVNLRTRVTRDVGRARPLKSRSEHARTLSATPRFVPVRVKSGSGSIPATASGITLHAENGIMLRLDREFDALTLGRLLGVLGDSSC